MYRESNRIISSQKGFLPIREGVSRRRRIYVQTVKFPPYTGGCIDPLTINFFAISVSSLYGRVYRCGQRSVLYVASFLPIREGVSAAVPKSLLTYLFPPYTGGCIDDGTAYQKSDRVSSLYGRVYRFTIKKEQTIRCFLPIREGVSKSCCPPSYKSLFPPYTGGCIGHP